MKDWINKLDDFLRISEREILTHAGNITHDDAIQHANTEFDKYQLNQNEQKSVAEKHFEQSMMQLRTAVANHSKIKL